MASTVLWLGPDHFAVLAAVSGHMQTQRAFRACLWQCPVWPAEGAPARHMVQQPRFQGQPGFIRVPSGGTGPSGSQNCVLATIARASHPLRAGLGCPLGGGLRMSSQRWPARLYLEGPFLPHVCLPASCLPARSCSRQRPRSPVSSRHRLCLVPTAVSLPGPPIGPWARRLTHPHSPLPGGSGHAARGPPGELC